MKYRVEDVASLVTDGTHYTPQHVSEGIPFLSVKDMAPTGLNVDGAPRISRLDFEAAERSSAAPRDGDVLLSKDGTVGKVHVVAGEGEFAVLSSIAIIRPRREIVDPRYLAWVLRSPGFLANAEKSKTGSAVRRIILADIKRQLIEVPPLPEQRRIAAILDEADALRTANNVAIDSFDHLLAAQFTSLFGPDGDGDAVAFGSLVESAQLGLVRGAKELSDDRTTPYLRMDSIQPNGRLRLTGLGKTDATEVERQKYGLLRDDFLFNTRNSRQWVGKVAVVAADTDAVFNNNILRVRFKEPYVARYLSELWRRPAIQRQLDRVKSGTTSVFAIYARDLMSIEVRVPDVELLKAFTHALTAIEEARSRAEARDVNSLFASLQHRAFRGEL